MYLLKRLPWLILVYSLTIISTRVSAHVLNETSAQVILRDGQIEVKIITDIDHLTSALQNNQTWLMGDMDQVMPTNLTANQQKHFIENILLGNTNLLINGQPIKLERIVFKNENNSDLNSSDNKAHAEVITLQAKHTFEKVTELAITFPKSLGVVHASFVKPQYKLLNAGDTAHFSF